MTQATNSRGAAASGARDDDRVLLLAASSREELLAMLESADFERVGGPSTITGEGPVRLAVGAPTAKKLRTVRKILERGSAWRGRSDIWFTESGLAAGGGRLALVYPGVEAGFEANVEEVARRFEIDIPDLSPPADLKSQAFGMIAVSRMMGEVLRKLGVTPDLLAGNSIGEWNGLIAAEAVPASSIDGFIASLNAFELVVPDVLYLAVGAGVDVAREAIEGLPNIVISHDNCRRQTVLCGKTASIEAARERLRAKRVLCEELAFRSGFHSPLFEPYLPPFTEAISRVPLQAPRIPVWSATTCEPYPSDAQDIRDLVTRAFIEPVYFRGLIEKLYDEGVRLFVQVGVGSLLGFISDTLDKAEHLGVAALSARVGSVGQVRRMAGALWVEGVTLAMEKLFEPGRTAVNGTAATNQHPEVVAVAPPVEVATPRASARRTPGRRPHARLVHEFEGVLEDIATASQDVLAMIGTTATPSTTARRARLPANGRAATRTRRGDAQSSRETAVRTPETSSAPPAQSGQSAPGTESNGERKATYEHRMSVARFPEFMDHCLYRQPPGWPNDADRFPIAPMTATIAMIMDAARTLVPERTVVGLEGFRNFRWMDVAPPADVTVQARYDGIDRVRVSVDGYARSTVLLADEYADAPRPRAEPMAEGHPTDINARELYDDRWMFHGPAYQGVIGLGNICEAGIDGHLETLAAPGALLDAAGQLMGYWILESLTHDRLILPVGVERIELFGPDPSVGSLFDCTVRICEVRPGDVRADLEVTSDGRVWARLEGWTDMRFISDQIVTDAARNPESLTLADAGARAFTLVRERWSNAAFRELMMRRYLGETERAEYHTLNPNAQRQWVLGRMAAKDAVRTWLWEHGHGPLFPIEVSVTNDEKGRPAVSGPFSEDLRISIAHKQSAAVAIVAEGRDVGIDLEPVEPRGERFADIALAKSEHALVTENDRDADLARLWTAKEAAAKAAGTGLGGRPKDFVVDRIEGNRMRIGDTELETKREDDFIVTWTT